MTNIFQVAIVIERNFFSVCSFHLILQFRDCYRALQKKFMLLTSLRHSLCSFLSKITVETIYNHVSWASFPESYNFPQENQSTEEQGRESHKASPGISGPCACIVWLLGPSPLPWSAPDCVLSVFPWTRSTLGERPHFLGSQRISAVSVAFVGLSCWLWDIV